MNVHAPSAPEPAPVTAAALRRDDEAQRTAIAQALWTEIHWLIPTDRRVTVTVDGDDITVAFGPRREAP